MADTRASSSPPAPPRHRRNWGAIAFLVLVVIPITGVALWTWAALSYSYAKGERAGVVQKISKKGWLCKTWEGELQMAPQQGTFTPQLFEFSVRNDSIADAIKSTIGERVSLSYEDHRGVPTSCFAETTYYIVAVTPVGAPAVPAPAVAPPPITAPAAPAPAVAAPATPVPTPAPATPVPAAPPRPRTLSAFHDAVSRSLVEFGIGARIRRPSPRLALVGPGVVSRPELVPTADMSARSPKQIRSRVGD